MFSHGDLIVGGAHQQVTEELHRKLGMAKEAVDLAQAKKVTNSCTLAAEECKLVTRENTGDDFEMLRSLTGIRLCPSDVPPFHSFTGRAMGEGQVARRAGGQGVRHALLARPRRPQVCIWYANSHHCSSLNCYIPVYRKCAGRCLMLCCVKSMHFVVSGKCCYCRRRVG